MRVLRNGDYRRMPWKNGGGETTEIAIAPDGAGLADFDWRISMATVASDGPFSVFPGIDRTLSILDGAGMTLFIEGCEPVLLTQQSEPLPFPADAPTSATLVSGPITDLNIMSRRNTLSHEVRRIAVDGKMEIPVEAATALLLCEGGNLDLAIAGKQASLSARDALVIENGVDRIIVLSGKASLFLIRFHAD